MEQNSIEDKLIDKFDINKEHPLFRTKEESEKLTYNKEPLPIGIKETNEQRQLQGQQSRFS